MAKNEIHLVLYPNINPSLWMAENGYHKQGLHINVNKHKLVVIL